MLTNHNQVSVFSSWIISQIYIPGLISNSWYTLIMVGLERQDAAKAVIAQKLLMWWLCANRVLVTLSSGGAGIVTMWYLLSWAPVLGRILSSEILCSGAQLHSQIFLSSWYTLLWSYLNLSGHMMSESSVSSVACRLQVWASWWNVRVLLSAPWWWKTGMVYKDDIQLFIHPCSKSVLNQGWFFVDHLCFVLDCIHSAWTYKITGTCLPAAPPGACYSHQIGDFCTPVL